MLEFMFWSSVAFIAFAYFGYPFVLMMYLNWPVKADDSLFYMSHGNLMDYIPKTVLVVSIANESPEIIQKKIQNTKNLVYALDALTVIFALDGTNKTTFENVILPEIQTCDHFLYLWSEKQSGKEVMQKRAVDASLDADVFIFTDVASKLNDDAIWHLTGHFFDPPIGVVDGESKILTETGEVSSEGLYLKYENAIRHLESQIGSIVTAGGCLFAVSSDVAKEMFSRPTQSDFGSALAANLLNKRGIIDRRAIAMFADLKDTKKEFGRKHRTILRGMNTLAAYRELLNPFRYGFFSFQLFGHKIAKWLVPVFMLIAFVSNFFLSVLMNNAIYDMLMLGQFIFYFIAYRGSLKVISFFVRSNIACAYALVDFIKGKNMMMWNASER